MPRTSSSTFCSQFCSHATHLNEPETMQLSPHGSRGRSLGKMIYCRNFYHRCSLRIYMHPSKSARVKDVIPKTADKMCEMMRRLDKPPNPAMSGQLLGRR